MPSSTNSMSNLRKLPSSKRQSPVPGLRRLWQAPRPSTKGALRTRALPLFAPRARSSLGLAHPKTRVSSSSLGSPMTKREKTSSPRCWFTSDSGFPEMHGAAPTTIVDVSAWTLASKITMITSSTMMTFTRLTRGQGHLALTFTTPSSHSASRSAALTSTPVKPSRTSG